MSNPKSESVWITHVVNPHQFYFKYTRDIANSEFSKFDFEIQRYGNELFARKEYTDELGYLPVENELVIFYNIIYNKWIRGRVVSLVKEITFWCIDNGICEKWVAPHVLPLTERFRKDMKLVHLGGLSLIPIEKTLNVETVEVETHLSEKWDMGSINMFKQIIDTSKKFMFKEEFKLENHKFGSLVIESKNATKEINRILLAMNKVAPSDQYADEDLWEYVHGARLETQLHQSIVNGTLIETEKLSNTSMKTVQRPSVKSGSAISSIESLVPNEDFDDSISRQSSDISTFMDSQTKSHRQSTDHRKAEQQPDVMRCENAKETEFLDDFSDSISLVSSSTKSRMSTQAQQVLNLINDQGYLRAFNAYFTENVRRQPLKTTVAWIDSMCKSNSSSDNKSYASSNTDSSNDRKSPRLTSTLTTGNATSTSTTTRKIMLASLSKRKLASDSTKTVNNSAIGGNRFGIPAGYLKSDLDTFGGLNKI